MIKITTIVRGLCPLFLSSDGTRGMFGALSVARHQLRVKFFKDQSQVKFVTEPGEVVQLLFSPGNNGQQISPIIPNKNPGPDSFDNILDFTGFLLPAPIYPLNYSTIKTRFYFNSGIVKACPVIWPPNWTGPRTEKFRLGGDSDHVLEREPKDIMVEKEFEENDEKCLLKIGANWEYEIVQPGNYSIEFLNDCDSSIDRTPDIIHVYAGIAQAAQHAQRVHYIPHQSTGGPGTSGLPIGVPRSCGGIFMGGVENF